MTIKFNEQSVKKIIADYENLNLDKKQMPTTAEYFEAFERLKNFEDKARIDILAESLKKRLTFSRYLFFMETAKSFLQKQYNVTADERALLQTDNQLWAQRENMRDRIEKTLILIKRKREPVEQVCDIINLIDTIMPIANELRDGLFDLKVKNMKKSYQAYCDRMKKKRH